MLNGQCILVTGGTGSFGRAFTRTILERYPGIRRLVIFSRDELKQFEMAEDFPKEQFPQLRFFIGDVRDGHRLKRALEGVDIVVHAAAMKQVPAAEYNPFECIQTNVLGAQNVIDACFDTKVKRVVALSTDKAAGPINLYGATKLCSDKLFVAANNMRGSRDIRLSVVRYGNVMGSRGSVIPFFLKKKQAGEPLPITDERMTRFNISLQEGVDMVLRAIGCMWGGEIFVPKIPSYRIMDVAHAIAPNLPIEIVGIRPGEKLHEEMITESDAHNTIEFDEYFVILPSMRLWDIKEFMLHYKGSRCPVGFKYNSGSNTKWLSVEQLRKQIETHFDAKFKERQGDIPACLNPEFHMAVSR